MPKKTNAMKHNTSTTQMASPLAACGITLFTKKKNIYLYTRPKWVEIFAPPLSHISSKSWAVRSA